MTYYPKEFASHFLGVGGIIIHEDKVLLVQLSYGRAQGYWLIPGGFVETGETLIEGVIREVQEETGMLVEPEGVIGVRSMVRERDHLTDVYCVFKCKLISNPKDIKLESEEITKVTWMDIEELLNDAKVLPYTKTIVKTALKVKKPMKLDPPLAPHIMKRFELAKYEQFWIDEL